MNIDIELAKVGFKWIINFNYNVGDFLFDAVAYLLKFKKNSKKIQKKFKKKVCFI